MSLEKEKVPASLSHSFLLVKLMVVSAKPEKKKPSEVKTTASSTSFAQKKRKQPQAPQ